MRDGFSWSAAHAPEVGGEFDVALSAEIDDSWSSGYFAANPERRIGLESLSGYAYLALGRISSVNPVRIDCGILVEERAIRTSRFACHRRVRWISYRGPRCGGLTRIIQTV